MPALPEFLERGGPVIWPLLGLSVLSLTLVVERALFFSWCGRSGWKRNAKRAADRLRAGDPAAARSAVEGDAGVLAPVVRAAAATPGRADAAAAEARAQAARIERLLPWLGVVVSAAPMLGILGTVLGIIASFDALAGPEGAGGAADPRAVGGGIAEALVSTAAGLTVTLSTLPAWVWLRGRADRLLDRIEDVLAAAEPRPPAAGSAASGR